MTRKVVQNTRISFSHVRGGVGHETTPEEVVQVYGICICTLRLPVISIMIIGVMRFSYTDRAVLDGRFRHLFQAVFMRMTYPSRYVYFRWSRVHTAVETAVTAPVGRVTNMKIKLRISNNLHNTHEELTDA